MKIKHKFKFVMLLLFANSFSYATDVTVNVNGKVLDQTCNVDDADVSQTIQFDDLEFRNLKTIGSVSESKKVEINLVNCTSLIRSISYQFTGEAVGSDNTLLKILGDGSSEPVAGGLAIQIMKNNSILSLGQKYSISGYQTGSNTYKFDFDLRYKSISTVSVGDASSVLYLDFFYE